MWRQYVTTLLLVCATLFLLGSFPGEATAQDRTPAYTSYVEQPAGLDDVVALFKRTPVPVRLYRVEGPDSLAVGEAGRFTGYANVEAASFPLRFRWDFGDGTAASSLHARHRYTRPGTYTVTFRLSNPVSEAVDTLTVAVMPSEHADELRTTR